MQVNNTQIRCATEKLGFRQREQYSYKDGVFFFFSRYYTYYTCIILWYKNNAPSNNPYFDTS